ncbi:MAG: 6-phosphogluconolactonase [Methylococcales symbiont of Iophon sp. n. MRB-2018]|nr:MAG: 6-phosphogluconolactonase [Methylococcales symbiont of Iophon sp. n. MRB-2018]KAF3979978.1 MAG: 6-phosphogluconolactonase [Methylococcales symbiont of Iophon sp. n. MRB-2018]
MQIINQWHPFATANQVAQAVCTQILQSAEQAISARACFHLVLAGGSTPEKVYQLLAHAKTNWSKWYIYYGDERCLAADNSERNSTMATNALLSKTDIPVENIFTMPTELGAIEATKKYRQSIAKVEQFDLVLLGMGEDGHTASLFPGHINDQDETVHAVYNSPKPPSDRISLSAKTLANTRQLFFIVTGASKCEPVKQWKQGVNLPVASIAPSAGVDIYIDQAALA